MLRLNRHEFSRDDPEAICAICGLTYQEAAAWRTTCRPPRRARTEDDTSTAESPGAGAIAQHFANMPRGNPSK